MLGGLVFIVVVKTNQIFVLQVRNILHISEANLSAPKLVVDFGSPQPARENVTAIVLFSKSAVDVLFGNAFQNFYEFL